MAYRGQSWGRGARLLYVERRGAQIDEAGAVDLGLCGMVVVFVVANTALSIHRPSPALPLATAQTPFLSPPVSLGLLSE